MSSIGTEYKINIKMDAVGDIHLSACDFFAIFYVNSTKMQQIQKEDMVEVDDDNYIALVDSTLTGAGALKARITVEIPDADFDDGKRTEVVVINTGIVIDK